MEIAGGADFIGFVGLCATDDTVPTYPATEVAWCLAAAHWGHGYAPEAATAALGFGFKSTPYDLILMGFVTVFTLVSVSLYLVEWVRHMSTIEAH